LEGCKKEIADFPQRQVWRVIKLHKVPKGHRLVGSKWVFKKKRDICTFCSCIVALGYNQIPGVDYTDNVSPVVGVETLHICLILWSIYDTDIGQVDVETVFLEGKLSPKEYQYLQCPEGVLIQEDECLEILGGRYGLVQVARVFWKKMTSTLGGIGFANCGADQCLFMQEP
jgi:hypothetical protein